MSPVESDRLKRGMLIWNISVTLLNIFILSTTSLSVPEYFVISVKVFILVKLLLHLSLYDIESMM